MSEPADAELPSAVIRSGSDRVTGYCSVCERRSFAVCAALDPCECHELDAIVQKSHIPAKATFARQGEKAASVFSVVEGIASIYRVLGSGRRQIVGFAIPGDFLHLAAHDRYNFSADAVSELTLYQFNSSDFDNLLLSKPLLLKFLYKNVSHDLAIMREQMTMLSRRSAEERVAVFLVAMRRRWSRIRGESVTIELPMQRLDIADYLGLTIETVSRTLTKLAREKVILIVPHAVRVLDEAHLNEIGGGYPPFADP